jgi:hypothetical protein
MVYQVVRVRVGAGEVMVLPISSLSSSSSVRE